MPLRIFEPRYTTMVRDCIKHQTGFGVCLIADGSEVGPPALAYPFGTLVEIIDWDMDDSGLLIIVAKGVRRFRTADVSSGANGLLLGDVELLPVESKTPIPAEYSELADMLERALDSVDETLSYTAADYTDACWVSGRLLELLPMTTEVKHKIVAMDNPVDRLNALQEYLDQQEW